MRNVANFFLVQQRARMEDALLQSTQMAAALPAAVGAYKNHPLYVLERHLGKVRGARPCCAGRGISCLGNFYVTCAQHDRSCMPGRISKKRSGMCTM
jgi:hypothetical protein